jgi:hypothetical protein
MRMAIIKPLIPRKMLRGMRYHELTQVERLTKNPQRTQIDF